MTAERSEVPAATAGLRRWERWLLVALVAAVAITVRWAHPVAPELALYPRPDVLEYVASAQAIVQAGQLYLQVGPERVRPRYPPGWPLLLAGFLRLGVPPLELWRTSALFGAALAALLALAASEVVPRLAGGGRRVRAGAWVGGLVAGLAWAMAPMAVSVGRGAMSDEPAALGGVGALLLLARGWLRAGGRYARLTCAGGGLLAGLAVAMRPTSALLLAVPLALLAAGALRLHGVRRAGPRLAAASATAVLGPALVCALLLRSGLSPWQWTAYELWVPRWYVSERVFALRHALQDNLEFPVASHGEPQSNLALGLRVLLGLPGVGPGGSLGPLWPLLGWLAALPLWRAGRRAGGGARRAMPWAAAAGAAWLLGHVVLFSLYFYPAARFYLGAAALCPLLLGSALGLLAAAPARAPRLAAALVAALLVAVQAVAAVPFARLLSVAPRSRPPLEQAVPRRVAAWLRQDDAERRRGRVVFDPVYAQALGLLPPEAVDRVGAWGRLPRSFHVHRLLRMERIARSEVVRRRPPARGAPAERRVPR